MLVFVRHLASPTDSLGEAFCVVGSIFLSFCGGGMCCRLCLNNAGVFRSLEVDAVVTSAL